MEFIKEYDLLDMFHYRKYRQGEYEIRVDIDITTNEKHISVKTDNPDFPEISVYGRECRMDFSMISYSLKDVDELLKNIKTAKELMKEIEEKYDEL